MNGVVKVTKDNSNGMRYARKVGRMGNSLGGK